MLPDDIPYYDAIDFDTEELSPDGIHPLYYSFTGHSPCYALLTEECKCAKRGSHDKEDILIGLKKLSKGTIKLMEITDGEVISERTISLKKLRNGRKTIGRSRDFVTASLNAGSSRTKTKQLCLMVNEFASPFGLRYITHIHK